MPDRGQSSTGDKPTASVADGFARRDRAIRRLHRKHPALVRKLQRAFLSLQLKDGPRTTDVLRLAVAIPSNVTPKVVGAAILALHHVYGLIVPDGPPVPSNRPLAHGRRIQVWK